MTLDQLKSFLQKVKGDSNLQEKLKAAADFDAVFAIAKDAGFSISAEEFMSAPEISGDLKIAQSAISEDELEGMAGGGCVHTAHCNCVKHFKGSLIMTV